MRRRQSPGSVGTDHRELLLGSSVFALKGSKSKPNNSLDRFLVVREGPLSYLHILASTLGARRTFSALTVLTALNGFGSAGSAGKIPLGGMRIRPPDLLLFLAIVCFLTAQAAGRREFVDFHSLGPAADVTCPVPDAATRSGRPWVESG